MSWQGLPATGETNILSFPFWNQFLSALRERFLITGIDYANVSYPPEENWIPVQYVDFLPPPNPQTGEYWHYPSQGEYWRTWVHPNYRVVYDVSDTPPESPSSSYPYAVGDNPTGIWAGKPRTIAYYNTFTGAWRFRERPWNHFYYPVDRTGVDTGYCLAFRNDVGWYCIGSIQLTGGTYTWDGANWIVQSTSNYYLGPSGERIMRKKTGTGSNVAIMSPQYARGDMDGYSWSGTGLPTMTLREVQRLATAATQYYVRPVEIDGAATAPMKYELNDWLEDIGIPEEGRFGSKGKLSGYPEYIEVGDVMAIHGPPIGGMFYGYDGCLAEYLGGDRWDSNSWSIIEPPVGYRFLEDRISYDPYWTMLPYRGFQRNVDGVWKEVGVGFTRKYPREIVTLDDPGEAGQRARFTGPLRAYNVAYSNSEVYRFGGADPPASPPFWTDTYYLIGQNATGAWEGHDGEITRWNASTSSWVFGERAYPEKSAVMCNVRAECVNYRRRNYYRYGGEPVSYVYSDGVWQRIDGCLYLHDGDGWVLDADQSTPPDIVTDYGEAQVGDYLGPWIYNELQAGINRLYRFKIGSTACLDPDDEDTPTLRYWQNGEMTGEYANAGAPYARAGRSGDNTYAECRAPWGRCTPQALLGNATAEVQWFGKITKGSFNAFHPLGSGFTEDVIHRLRTDSDVAVQAGQPVYSGGRLNSLNEPTTFPTTSDHGWAASELFALVDWPFEYTA